MELGIGIAIGAVVGGGIAYALGRGGARAEGLAEGRTEAASTLKAATEALGRGRLPDGAAPGSAEAELHAALERGWAPRETERRAALEEAIGRVSGFLDSSVRGPLRGAHDGASAAELRDRMDRALGALADLDFFLEQPPSERGTHDVAQLVQQVAREFSGDQNVGLRLQMDGNPARASVNPHALMDGLYLVLHNAGRFGGGSTIDVTVESGSGQVVVKVRDRGEGFSKEAFDRAFDPFYSTSDGGLGLGLPHARGLIESMGGKIELRNVPDGGAEVELTFSAS